MKREDIEPFLGKFVKLTQNGFVLKGTITKISEESIVFETSQAKSVINIKNISSIVERIK